MRKNRLTHIKWIGPNDPMIIVGRNNARLYLTKRELADLAIEIDHFMKYYSEDFSEGRIDVETPPEDGNTFAGAWANNG